MRRLAGLLFLAVGLLGADNASAGSYADWENWMSSATAIRPPAFGEQRFRSNVGAGVAYAPVYFGGTNFEAKFLPLLDTEYADRLFLSTQKGIGYNLWRSRTSKIAPRITWDFGRDPSDDPDLAGTTSIDPAIELGLYWESFLKTWRFKADIRKDFGDGHGGMLINGDAAIGGRWSKQVSLILGGRTTYMDETYAQSYFGTSAYKADSGLRDINGYVQLVFDLPKGFYMSGEVRGTYLLAASSESPITKTDSFFTGALLAGIRF